MDRLTYLGTRKLDVRFGRRDGALAWFIRHTRNKAFEEGLFGEVLVVLFKVLFGGSHELYSGKLIAVEQVRWKAIDCNGYWEREAYPRFSKREMMSPTRPRCGIA